LLLRELSLLNFRTYRSFSFAPAPGVNLIWGENGAGKTNLLEAIYLLGQGMTSRTRREEELILAGEERALVRARLEGRRGCFTVAVEIGRGGRKRNLLDGREVPAGVLERRVPVVYLGVEDLEIVSGPPLFRRRFLDRLISLAYPVYSSLLERFRALLRERNAALREVRAGRMSRDLLTIWDDPFRDLAEEIWRRREEFRPLLAARLREAWELLGGEGEMKVIHLPAREESLLGREEEMGVSLWGPHRDGWELEKDGLSVRHFASQGERRTLLAALKWTEAALLRERAGEEPILLLDDFFSDLDERRRERFLSAARQAEQAFITSAYSHIMEDGEGTSFLIERRLGSLA
jgi:DNA replication and repair protein RecF